MRKVTTCEDCNETFQSKKLWSEHRRNENCIKNDVTDGDDDDIVLLDDDVPEVKAAELSRTITNETLNQNEEMTEEVETQEEEIDEDIQVVKSSIYKYYGNLNLNEQIKGDYFNFKYFDDFEDNDDVILMEEEEPEQEDIEEIVEEDDATEDESIDAGEKMDKKENESDRKIDIPVQKMEMKKFPGGNFFMLAS